MTNTYLHLQKIYQHHNRQGADLVLEARQHDSLIKWTIWGQVTVWKIYISIFMRFIANKLSRPLTLGITQTLKLSSTTYSFSFCVCALAHNALQLPFFFFFFFFSFYFSPSQQDFGRTGKNYLPFFVPLLLWVRVTRIGVNNMICPVLSTHVL